VLNVRLVFGLGKKQDLTLAFEPSSKGHEKVKKEIFYLNGNKISPIN